VDPRTPQNFTRIVRPPREMRLFESSPDGARSSIQSLVTPRVSRFRRVVLPAMQNHADAVFGAESDAGHGDNGMIGNNFEAKFLCDGCH
jgi:hypothetical protein